MGVSKGREIENTLLLALPASSPDTTTKINVPTGAAGRHSSRAGGDPEVVTLERGPLCCPEAQPAGCWREARLGAIWNIPSCLQNKPPKGEGQRENVTQPAFPVFQPSPSCGLPGLLTLQTRGGTARPPSLPPPPSGRNQGPTLSSLQGRAPSPRGKRECSPSRRPVLTAAAVWSTQGQGGVQGAVWSWRAEEGWGGTAPLACSRLLQADHAQAQRKRIYF